MFKLLSVFALAGVFVFGASGIGEDLTPSHATAIEAQHVATHRIGIYDLQNSGTAKEVGHCSATVIGPHAILTAQHCFNDSNLVRLDSEKNPTKIISALLDGNDHLIYIVDRTFTAWAQVEERALVPNEPVHFWGSPGENTDVFRSGYFQNLVIIKELDPNCAYQKFILPTFHGDSGSGIFDQYGKVVAVVFLADTSANELSLPLAFTSAQLASVR